MKGKMKDGKDCYAKGGGIDKEPLESGKKEVADEAEGKEAENEPSDDEGAEEKKHGGRVKKKRGGKVDGKAHEREGEHERMALKEHAREERAHGGHIKIGHKMEGMGKKPHLGRPMRASGGRTGSDRMPLSS